MSASSTKKPRTPAQTAASRENGKKSTGPNDTSETRFNAIKHGILCQFTRFQSDQDREVFTQLEDGMHNEWHPQTQSEHFYVERLTQCMWRMRLAARRQWKRDKMMIETELLMLRYERELGREITVCENKLRELRRQREEQENAQRQAEFAETNPSAEAEAAAAELMDPAAVESLRRLTRVFEANGGASPEDGEMLKQAARTHLRVVVPRLEILAQKATG